MTIQSSQNDTEEEIENVKKRLGSICEEIVERDAQFRV